MQSAAVGGASHLVNFNGTATIAGVILARQVDRWPDVKGLVSIPMHVSGCGGMGGGAGGWGEIHTYIDTILLYKFNDIYIIRRDYYGCKMAGFAIPAAEHR